MDLKKNLNSELEKLKHMSVKDKYRVLFRIIN